MDEWFRLYDKSETGKMNREEVGALLTAIKREDLGEPDAIVDEKLVDQIISKFDVTKDGEIERTELLPAVKKYRALLRHKGKLEALFQRHDTDLDEMSERAHHLAKCILVRPHAAYSFADAGKALLHCALVPKHVFTPEACCL